MHSDRAIVERRIERELWERVLPHLHRASRPLDLRAWHVPGEPVPFTAAAEAFAGGRFAPIEIGAPWGPPWSTTWFHLALDVPLEWRDSAEANAVEAVIDLGFRGDSAGFQAEGLVWFEGRPLQGVHPRRTAVPFDISGRSRLEFFVEAAANPMLGPGYQPSPMGARDTAPHHPLYRVRRADLALRDDEVFHLLLDAEVALGTLRALTDTDPRRHHLLGALERCLDALDERDVANTAALARQRLGDQLRVPSRASASATIAVGHAHIDTAWLWPLRETRRKVARTFASAVRLMEQYPDYRFVCSQAVQYHWVEEEHPSLFERIREEVAAGRFVPVGGMWVEADMNLPSGESIVRQFVHGQRYFEQRFGLRCREVWIPDVFGYPASLPQIFAAAGCDRFVTQKLSWNKQNRFPHHTFVWEGIDGTQVLTHFPPVDTYNAEMQPGQLVFAEANFRDHGWSRWTLLPFGYGNGGGGPTREMVERARRLGDLDGVPRVHLATPSEFFERVEHEAVSGAAPVWRGELYFEMHRGTLTSQLRTKEGNRRCERLLREAELWWSAAARLRPDRWAEVAVELDGLWKDVLVQQFHDILPGSSIAWVHADAEAAFGRIAARLEELTSEALELAAGGHGPVLANAATRRRREVAIVDVTASDADGPTGQRLSDGRSAVVVDVPGAGVARLGGATGGFDGDPVVTTEHSMTNGLLCVQWDLDGSIVSIIDVRHGRELLPPGRRVAFELAPDLPVEYDAWDLESWTTSRGQPLDAHHGTPATSVELLDRGPLVARLRVTRTFHASTLVTDVVLRAGSARLDLEVDLDWQERERLLSLMVPLDVRTDQAICGIQFGNVHRPTHPSSPWDAAKFEVCAHGYVDLAEPSFGVAVLDDGRYGHGLFDGGVRVSIARGPQFPDPDADRGRHRVTVAVLPHGPGLHDVLAETEALRMPLRVVVPSRSTVGSTASGHETAPLVSIDHPGVEWSAMKIADDDPTTRDVVLRLYEACGDRAAVTIRLDTAVTAAWRCDALEGPVSAVDVTDGAVALTLRPFEVLTLRLTR